MAPAALDQARARPVVVVVVLEVPEVPEGWVERQTKRVVVVVVGRHLQEARAARAAVVALRWLQAAAARVARVPAAVAVRLELKAAAAVVVVAPRTQGETRLLLRVAPAAQPAAARVVRAIPILAVPRATQVDKVLAAAAAALALLVRVEMAAREATVVQPVGLVI